MRSLSPGLRVTVTLGLISSLYSPVRTQLREVPEAGRRDCLFPLCLLPCCSVRSSLAHESKGTSSAIHSLTEKKKIPHKKCGHFPRMRIVQYNTYSDMSNFAVQQAKCFLNSFSSIVIKYWLGAVSISKRYWLWV